MQEAATLAAMLTSESHYSPWRFPDRAKEKRATLEKVALEASKRFGSGALVHAGTIESGSRRASRGEDKERTT